MCLEIYEPCISANGQKSRLWRGAQLGEMHFPTENIVYLFDFPSALRPEVQLFRDPIKVAFGSKTLFSLERKNQFVCFPTAKKMFFVSQMPGSNLSPHEVCCPCSWRYESHRFMKSAAGFDRAWGRLGENCKDFSGTSVDRKRSLLPSPPPN